MGPSILFDYREMGVYTTYSLYRYDLLFIDRRGRTMESNTNTASSEKESYEVEKLSTLDDKVHSMINIAFGQFLTGFGIPVDEKEPWPGVTYIEKAKIDQSIALGVRDGSGDIIGVALSSVWGDIAVFGPLAVHPNHQRKGIARVLMDSSLKELKAEGIKKVGLFTFPGSEAHEDLYIKTFGFDKKNLNPVRGKTAEKKELPSENSVVLYSQLGTEERDDVLQKAKVLTAKLDSHLSLSNEIKSTTGKFSETLFVLNKENSICALAVCHYGNGSEAGNKTLLIKFGMGDPDMPGTDKMLLAACENLALEKGMTTVHAGIDASVESERKILEENGFDIECLAGVMMIKDLTGDGDTNFNSSKHPAFFDWR